MPCIRVIAKIASLSKNAEEKGTPPPFPSFQFVSFLCTLINSVFLPKGKVAASA